MKIKITNYIKLLLHFIVVMLCWKLAIYYDTLNLQLNSTEMLVLGTLIFSFTFMLTLSGVLSISRYFFKIK